MSPLFKPESNKIRRSHNHDTVLSYNGIRHDCTQEEQMEEGISNL
jgi:hypothetical protein